MFDLNDKLYLITDLSYGIEKIEQALSAGIDLLQLREKALSSREYLEHAKRLRKLTRNYNTKLIINDRLDIALLSEADGVHLGQEDIPIGDARKLFPTGMIGATCKTVEQADAAAKSGADYIGSGAWFQSTTKPNAVPILPELFSKIAATTPLPVFAIGGITAENAYLPMRYGAFSVVASSGIMNSHNIEKTVDLFRKTINNKG